MTAAMYVGRQPAGFFAATLRRISGGLNGQAAKVIEEIVVGNIIGAGLLSLPVFVVAALFCLSLV